MSDDNREQEEVWVADERAKVIAYLSAAGVDHLGVGEWPAFHLHPYLAIWAIQSKIQPGAIGWWAISGDAPTDYMSGAGVRHPRKAMAHFSREWAEVADCMRQGVEHPGTKIGKKEDWPMLAPLLQSRSELLGDFAKNDELWEERESERPNKAPEPTTMAVTSRAPSSTARASHGRGSS